MPGRFIPVFLKTRNPQKTRPGRRRGVLVI
jgi:hypothetical protein